MTICRPLRSSIVHYPHTQKTHLPHSTFHPFMALFVHTTRCTDHTSSLTHLSLSRTPSVTYSDGTVVQIRVGGHCMRPDPTHVSHMTALMHGWLAYHLILSVESSQSRESLIYLHCDNEWMMPLLAGVVDLCSKNGATATAFNRFGRKRFEGTEGTNRGEGSHASVSKEHFASRRREADGG